MNSNFEMSPEIGELASALAAAQAEVKGATKDSKNPFFKSNYADLQSVWDACREPLTKNGLSIAQFPVTDEEGVSVVTVLSHKSGQWMRGKLKLTPKANDPQGIGSAVTYGRRYSLAAAVGIYQTDDDAEGAMNRNDRVSEVEEVKYAGNKNPITVVGALASVTEKDGKIWAQVDGHTCYAATEPNKSRMLENADKDVEVLLLETDKKDKKKNPIFSLHMITPWVAPTEKVTQ
jgi:hypothetical protein